MREIRLRDAKVSSSPVVKRKSAISPPDRESKDKGRLQLLVEKLPIWPELRDPVCYALKWWGLVSFLVVVWSGLSYAAVLVKTFTDAAGLVIGVVLFVISLPVSAIFRLDSLLESVAPQASIEAGLLLALLYVGVNFLLIAALKGCLRRLKSKLSKD